MSLVVNIRSLSTPGAVLMRNLRLSVAPGCIHTVMGPSGSGKSTLLSALSGTLDPALDFDGDITLNGRQIAALPIEHRRVGILFQDDLLYAHMSVAENLLFAVPAGPKQARMQTMRQALQDIELPNLADANPATLSGGQRARVSLMRALLAQPQALLLDEPFSKLDTALRGRMRQLLGQMVHLRQIPVVLVTHDEDDIYDLAQLTRLGPIAVPSQSRPPMHI